MNSQRSESENSYGQIVKSSSIMGGVAGITMILGMIRTKFAAVLIGTGGVGLLASLNAILELLSTIAGLGIASSAVRDIAVAVGKSDQQAIGRAVLTLRRMCWLTGTFGMLTMVVLSPVVGQLTFESDVHNLEIASMGLIILLANISGGQMALIQGTRRVGDIARVNIISAVAATVVTIGFYFWLGLSGIVPALVLAAAIQLAVSRQFAKRVPVPAVVMSWRESFDEASCMVKLGVAMMWTGMVSSLVTYATVTMISKEFDLHSLGIYSAAYALSGLFVNFVLQAMGTDYYPRLAGLVDDHAAMNKLVNEQTEVGLLLAVPGMLATLVLAPWMIELLYTKEFMPAVELLQWFILGCFVRVFQWPIGFLQLALGKGGIWFGTQSLFSIVHVILIWVGIQFIGMEGVAIAFFLLYIFSSGVIKFVGKYLTSFEWDKSVFNLIAKLVPAVVIAFCIGRLGGSLLLNLVSFGLVIAVSIYSLRTLISRIGEGHRISRILFRIPGLRRLAIG
ncbi:O-antigen translocase [Mariprofundus erugo]|uniref:O-antigen translocase n=1 Tax=Mariprofundus erugo TaxID=2528639 RepID=UPI0010FEF561|nr:O-antigen translocase [Mariprofundus erugo]TLS78413.1 O-antigen translocase [Mariprofundus erugo]